MYPHLQLFQYILSRWLKTFYEKTKNERRQKLPLMIPIILYHGTKKWDFKPFLGCLGFLPPGFERFIPEINYILIDLSKVTDATILALKNTPLLNVLILLKHTYDKKWLKENVKIVVTNGHQLMTDEQTSSLFKSIIGYYGKRIDLRIENESKFLMKSTTKL
jgi:Putative transposase, YhgA-like